MKRNTAAILISTFSLLGLLESRSAFAVCNTSITGGPSAPTPSTSATFTFTSSGCSSGFQCKLDSGSFAACTSPKAYSGLAQGSHTFQVKATGDATPATRAWSVDTVVPNTTVDSGPGPTNTATPSFTFSSNEALVQFQCKIDNPFSPFVAYCWSGAAIAAQTEGQHTFWVRAIDPAGNADASPASRIFTVDLTAPDTSITSAPSSPSQSSTLSFSFTATESSTFECSMDGLAFTSCTSPKVYSSVAVGAHEFRVRAVDLAGNVDASPTFADVTVNAAACP